MRPVVFALVLALVPMLGHPASAQTAPEANARLELALAPNGAFAQNLATDHQIKVGRSMRATGIALTLVGAAMTGVGGYYLLKGFFGPDADKSDHWTNTRLAGGGVALGVGQAAAAAGIVLWANGQYRVSKAQRVKLAASGSGIGLSF